MRRDLTRGSRGRGRFGNADSRGALGPIGTASRVAVGLMALAVGVVRADVGWWDVAAAAVAFPLVAALLAGVPLPTSPGSARYLHGVLAVGVAVALTFVTPADAPAVWLWLGGSLLLGAACGDAGCEVLAVANLLTGRRQHGGCILFTPIDAAESRRIARHPSAR